MMKTREQMIEAAEVYGRHNLVTLSRELKEFLADFAREQIEEAIAAERSRVVAALEAKLIKSSLPDAYARKGLTTVCGAIEIVKGGGDDNN